MVVVRKEVQHQLVGARDVGGVAGERHPSERTLPLTEQGTDVLRDEPRDLERVAHARVERHGADVVAVVEGDGAAPLQGEHRAHVPHGGRGAGGDVGVRIPVAQRGCLGERHAVGEVAAQHVVRARLVGEHVHRDVQADELLQGGRRIHHHAHRVRAPLTACRLGQGQAFLEGAGLGIAISGRQALVDARLVHVEREHGCSLHRRGQRLRAAHAAEPRGHDEPAGEGAAEVHAADGAQGLVRPLDDPLRANVDPRARGHLPVHHQPLPLERAEMLPCRPAADEVGVRDQDARRAAVRAEHGDRLAALHEERLVVRQRAQRRDDRIERLPAPRCLSRAAVHHQLVRPLRNVGVEVVHEHAEGGLLLPSLARDGRAARCTHRSSARDVRGDGRHAVPAVSREKCPRSIACASVTMSVESTRSCSRGATSWRTRRWPCSAPRPARSGFR